MPIKSIDSSSSSYSSEHIQNKTSLKALSAQDKATQAIMREVNLALNPPRSLRLRIWSKIAPHISQDKAKFLSKIILSRSLVARDNVASVAHMLSSRYIPSIVKDQISMIRPEDISRMDIKQIRALTEEQIASFTSEQITELPINAFIELCENINSSCVPLMEKRLEIVKTGFDAINPQDYFNDPGVSSFNVDMPRLPFLNISGPNDNVRLTYPEANTVAVIFNDLIGKEATEHLKKVFNQGFSEPYAKVIASAFYDNNSWDSLRFQQMSTQKGFDVVLEDNQLIITTTTSYTIQLLQDIGDQHDDRALVRSTKTVMTLPLEGLRNGDFSHASITCQLLPANQE